MRPSLRLIFLAISVMYMAVGCRVAAPAVELLSTQNGRHAAQTASVPAAEQPATNRPPVSPAPGTQPSPLLPTAPRPPAPTQSMPPTETIVNRDPTRPAVVRLSIFLIAIGDNGAAGRLIGCGDSVVPVEIEVPFTEGVLRAALEYLIAQMDQYHGDSGLYNALYQSNLRLDDVSIVDGTARIWLAGQFRLGGTCDTPRVIAQLEQTALQFPTVQRVSVLINGIAIHEALSQSD